MDYVGDFMKDREESVRRCIPDLLNYKTVLYVGARPTRQHFLDWFEDAEYSITIVEAFKKNCDFLKEKFNHKIIHGDIRYCEIDNYDVVFFWHGIEHLPMSDIPNTLRKLESKSNFMTVLGMPYGLYVQDDIFENKFEIHQSQIYPDFLKEQGYDFETLGDIDQRGANITAWKIK